MNSMHRLSKIMIASILTVVAISILCYVLPLVHVYEHVEYFHGINVRIAYFKLLIPKEPVFEIRYFNLSNPLPVTVSVYIIEPPFTIRELGFYHGRGVVKLDYDKLVQVYRKWIAYLREKGVDPSAVEIGLILLANAHTRNGIYHIFRIVPIKPIRLLKGYSITIEIREDLRKRKPLVTREEIEKIIEKLRSKYVAANRTLLRASLSHASLDEFPPTLEQGCICDWYSGCTCWYWKPYKIYYISKKPIGIPIIMVHVSELSQNSLEIVTPRIIFYSEEETSDYVAFGTSFAINTESGISYEMPGFSIVLGVPDGYESWIWLNYYEDFRNGLNFTGDALIGFGFKGYVAFAEYREYICEYPSPETPWAPTYCYWGDKWANATIAAPEMRNNSLVGWYMIDDNPYDGQGYLERIWNIVNRLWEYNYKYYGYRKSMLSIASLDVVKQIKTEPLFSASIPVLAILAAAGYDVPLIAAFAPIMSISVGKTYEKTTVSICMVDIYACPSCYVYAWYLYSPTYIKYKGEYYRIGSMYVDVWTAKW